MQKEAEKVNVSSPFMSLPAAADHLGLTVNTLYQWRSKGIGPTGVLLGGRVRYRRADLDAWIADAEKAEADRVARIHQIAG